MKIKMRFPAMAARVFSANAKSASEKTGHRSAMK